MRQYESIHRRRGYWQKGGLTVHTRISQDMNYVLMLKQRKENIKCWNDEREWSDRAPECSRGDKSVKFHGTSREREKENENDRINTYNFLNIEMSTMLLQKKGFLVEILSITNHIYSISVSVKHIFLTLQSNNYTMTRRNPRDA